MDLKVNIYLLFSLITTTPGLFLFSDKLEKTLSPEIAALSTKFYFFSRKNANFSQEINPSKIPQSLLNRHHPVRFIIHGWQGHHNQTEFIAIKNSYLKRANFNIILVDWSFASSASYVFLTSYIKHIGHAVGIFIKEMSTTIRISLDKVYIIGFSIGAHIAGIAGKSLYPDKINTIFGLDAAGPIFEQSDFENKLKQTDAKYVETIHTNIQGGLFPLGHAKPIGVASFYPAYGRVQPGCMVLLCSHGRSREYFAESIDPDVWFVGKKCKNYKEIEDKTCTETNDVSLMGGEPSRKHREGIYYVEVEDESPFGHRNNY